MPKNSLLKQQEAEKRQQKRNSRNAKQQLEFLNSKFGKDLGAKKERQKLTNFMEKQKLDEKVEKVEKKKKKKNV